MADKHQIGKTVEPTTDAGTRQRIQTGALIIIAGAVLLFLLVQARFMLTSLAVAIILFSLTSDAIAYISRLKIGPLRIPNWLASLAALLLISTGLFMLSSLVLSQVNTVLSTTLVYTERVPAATADLFAWMGPEVETAIQNAMGSVDVSGYLRTVAGQAGGLMQGTVLVILFVGFLFAERLWFEVKLTSLMGGDADRAAQVQRIIGTIMHRVNYYLLVKTVVSAVTGLMVYAVAYAFNLELAVAIGVLTFILNYIPNVGSIVATVLATLVTYVQIGEPGPTMAFFVAVGIDPVRERQHHRSMADGAHVAAVDLRHHRVAGLLGGGLGHRGHVPVGADHGRGDDRVQPCRRNCAPSPFYCRAKACPTARSPRPDARRRIAATLTRLRAAPRERRRRNVPRAARPTGGQDPADPMA